MKFNFLLFIFLLLFSCNRESEDLKQWSKIIDLHTAKDYDNCLVNLHSLIDLYPNSIKIPNVYFLISEIYMNEYKEYNISLSYLKLILDKYPDHELSKKSLFTLGYINANYLEAYTRATYYYNIFLTTYPDDDLVPSVNYELDNLSNLNLKVKSLLKN